jgi:hypothetical protein
MDNVSKPPQGPTAFVMMPFSADFDDVYSTIKAAVAAVDSGVRTVKLDEVLAAGRISDDLVHHLTESTLCVADVTGANPNVMWEVGFAAALKKPLIALNQRDGRLPFDISDVRTLTYDRRALSATLAGPLTEAIRQTLERYAVRSSHVPAPERHRKPNTIAVTGSMDCAPDSARARLQRVLEPYLGKDADWLLGSYGVVDETAAQLLLDAGETRLTVVGHTSYDISGGMLSLLDRHDELVFIDASAEQLPQLSDAPTPRDLLFAARADLMLIGWNGVSQGTRALIDWLSLQNKDHLVCYVQSLRNRSFLRTVR